MGKCSNCGKKILHNRYKMYRRKVLCPECYDTRLERKAEKIAEVKRRAEEVRIVTPSKKAKKAMKKKGLTGTFNPSIMDGHALTADDVKQDEENENKTEDSD